MESVAQKPAEATSIEKPSLALMLAEPPALHGELAEFSFAKLSASIDWLFASVQTLHVGLTNIANHLAESAPEDFEEYEKSHARLRALEMHLGVGSESGMEMDEDGLYPAFPSARISEAMGLGQLSREDEEEFDDKLPSPKGGTAVSSRAQSPLAGGMRRTSMNPGVAAFDEARVEGIVKHVIKDDMNRLDELINQVKEDINACATLSDIHGHQQRTAAFIEQTEAAHVEAKKNEERYAEANNELIGRVAAVEAAAANATSLERSVPKDLTEHLEEHDRRLSAGEERLDELEDTVSELEAPAPAGSKKRRGPKTIEDLGKIDVEEEVERLRGMVEAIGGQVGISFFQIDGLSKKDTFPTPSQRRTQARPSGMSKTSPGKFFGGTPGNAASECMGTTGQSTYSTTCPPSAGSDGTENVGDNTPSYAEGADDKSEFKERRKSRRKTTLDSGGGMTPFERQRMSEVDAKTQEMAQQMESFAYAQDKLFMSMRHIEKKHGSLDDKVDDVWKRLPQEIGPMLKTMGFHVGGGARRGGSNQDSQDYGDDETSDPMSPISTGGKMDVLSGLAVREAIAIQELENGYTSLRTDIAALSDRLDTWTQHAPGCLGRARQGSSLLARGPGSERSDPARPASSSGDVASTSALARDLFGTSPADAEREGLVGATAEEAGATSDPAAPGAVPPPPPPESTFARTDPLANSGLRHAARGDRGASTSASSKRGRVTTSDSPPRYAPGGCHERCVMPTCPRSLDMAKSLSRLPELDQRRTRKGVGTGFGDNGRLKGAPLNPYI